MPTSYQYGCAWNAGTKGGGRDPLLTGRHYGNRGDGKGGFKAKHTSVGSYQPNEWGIYDLHGNVWEMCLDYTGKGATENDSDPEGPLEGEKRHLRGGCWNSYNNFIFSEFVPHKNEANNTPGNQGKHGCRIVINVRSKMTMNAERQPKVMTGPYGIRMEVEPGCEKGAEYVLGRLRDDWLPRSLQYYGDPFVGKTSSRVYTIKVKRNDGSGKSKYIGPTGGFGFGRGNIGLARDSDRYEFALDWLAASVLTVCEEPNSSSFQQYVKRFIDGVAKGQDPVPQIKKDIQVGLNMEGGDRRKRYPYMHTSMWAVFEELREKHPKFMQGYYQLKNSRFAEGRLPEKLSFDQVASLLSEVTHENVAELFKKYGVGAG